MDFNYLETFGVTQDAPYERLLIDAIRGDLTLFARQPEIQMQGPKVSLVIKERIVPLVMVVLYGCCFSEQYSGYFHSVGQGQLLWAC